MAKRQRSKEPSSLPSLPPRIMAMLLAGIAGIAVIAGLGILWQTWRASNTGSAAPELEALRNAVATQVGQRIDESIKQFDSHLGDAQIQSTVAAGNYETAVGHLQRIWPELKEVSIHSPDLDTAFGQDIRQIGYGKLALLTAAGSDAAGAAGVVGSNQQLDLGLAAPVRQGERIIGIAYGQLPLNIITAPVNDARLSKGYLVLSSGQSVLMQKGDKELRHGAQYTPVEGMPLRVGTGAPVFESTLPYSATTQLIMGVGALLLGLILGRHAKTTLQRAREEAPPEPTLADSLQQMQTPAAPVQIKTVVSGPAVPTATDDDGKEPVGIGMIDEPRADPYHSTLILDRSIFRAYDIRGVLGQTLDAGIAFKIGQSIGTVMAERGLQQIVVGRDGRLSGPELSQALIDGLRQSGRDVIDIGLAPTPVVYFASHLLHTGSCVAVTGSHNPPDYNGFKIVLGGETLSGDHILDLYLRIVDDLLDSDGNGGLQSMDVLNDYISRIASDIQLERPIKVVVDAGNGVAGLIAPQVLQAIGAEVVPLHCEVDGTFPNHHPDPSEPHNLVDLIRTVKQTGAELGLAFDGDGDRLGVVTQRGEMIFPDRVLMLFARDVLGRNPGATIIYDVKCTGHLAGQILRHGGSPLMWKTGHSLIKAKMRETDAELAGEMSGHFFFRERWFGFDDGIYAAARLLEILVAEPRSIEEIFDELPKGASTPELKITMAEGEHYTFMQRFIAQAQFDGATISHIDGVRADWPDGWGLVRSSNTTPCLVLRFDADDEVALMRIQIAFREQLLALDPSLDIPF